MSEPFAWPEGALHLWTGHHTASGSPIAFVRNVSLNPQWQWDSRPALNGAYRQHLVGQRADFGFQVDYLLGAGLPVLFQGAAGVHAKFVHSNPLGSAGYFVYSGVLTNANLAGADAAIFTHTFNGFGHIWSAF